MLSRCAANKSAINRMDCSTLTRKEKNVILEGSEQRKDHAEQNKQPNKERNGFLTAKEQVNPSPDGCSLHAKSRGTTRGVGTLEEAELWCS